MAGAVACMRRAALHCLARASAVPAWTAASMARGGSPWSSGPLGRQSWQAGPGVHHGLATQSYGYLLRKETDAAAKEDAAVAASPSSFEAWGQALQEGDWDTAWEIFESRFPEDPDFPSLDEVLSKDPEAQEKAARRERERALQERAAASHVRIVDETGTAHAAGRRKTSVARVWLREGSGLIMVNAVPYDMHWRSLARRNDVITPLALTQRLGMYDVMICVRGGGDTGQAQAARHGIARALQRQDPTLRPMLKAAGLLARDARIVERKKPGRKKARKSFQWVKR